MIATRILNLKITIPHSVNHPVKSILRIGFPFAAIGIAVYFLGLAWGERSRLIGMPSTMRNQGETAPKNAAPIQDQTKQDAKIAALESELTREREAKREAERKAVRDREAREKAEKIAAEELRAKQEAQARASKEAEQARAQQAKAEALISERREFASRISDLNQKVENLKEQQSRSQTPVVEIQPRIEIASSPPPKSADIIIKSVSVAASKKDGDDWDAGGGPPDLKVYIEQTSLFGSSFTTSVVQNSGYASFNVKSIRVKEGDQIRIVVYDQDFLDDDIIGEYEKIITSDTINQRVVEWNFDQVSTLRLEFQP